jgi:hypothetical protein
LLYGRPEFDYQLRKGFPTELTSDEEMERNLGEWRRINVLYECDGMNVCTIKYQNKQQTYVNPTAFCVHVMKMADKIAKMEKRGGLFHRVHTEWRLPISGVHPIMMEK